MGIAVCTAISFTVLADGRDACIEMMDNVGAAFTAEIGGTPWLKVDDDVRKIQSQSTIKDDQGACYSGKVTLTFAGPFLADMKENTHPGYDTQKGIGDAQ